MVTLEQVEKAIEAVREGLLEITVEDNLEYWDRFKKPPEYLSIPDLCAALHFITYRHNDLHESKKVEKL